MYRIVVGRGNNRHTFDVPPARDRVGRDKIAEDLKNFLFRPAMLAR
jgi:hypothetical protein